MDFVADRNNPKPIYRVASLVELPEYVKSAAVITPEEVAPLASIAFATGREYPIHTKAATYLSYAYWRGTDGSPDSPVAVRIKAAAEHFGITADLAAIDDALRTEKSASAEPTPYALPAGSVEGVTIDLYPMGDRFEVEASAHQLARDISRMPSEVFYKAATALVEADGGAVMPRAVKVAGTRRLPDLEKAALWLSDRKRDVPPAIYECYREAIKIATENPGTEVELVSTLNAIDKEAGLRGRHTPPHEAVFSGTPVVEIEKFASEMTILADRLVPLSAVQALSEDDLKSSFSGDSLQRVLAWHKAAGQSALAATRAADELSPTAATHLLKLAVANG